MKYALFFLACLFCAARTRAQVKGAAKGTFLQEETRLKVLFTRSGITAIYMDRTVPINNIQGLDSLIKKIPDVEHQKIEYENRNADPQKSLEIIRTLEKCHCHLVTKSVGIMSN